VITHYLEALYYIRAEGEVARSARLADWLGVSRPTVTVALRRMIRDGMVRLTPAKEIQLTPQGEEAAAAIVRRHRVVERWLTDALGLDWIQADEEAGRLEHAVSATVEARLYASLGKPATCPHGNPIPGYSEARRGEVRLSGLAEGARGTVTRISEVAQREAPALLQYLYERRLTPGRPVSVLETDQVADTLRIRVAGRDVTLGQDTAGKVWVFPLGSGRR